MTKKDKHRVKSRTVAIELQSPRELVVRTHEGVQVRLQRDGGASASDQNVSALQSVLARQGCKLTPLFGEGEERLEAERSALAPNADG